MISLRSSRHMPNWLPAFKRKRTSTGCAGILPSSISLCTQELISSNCKGDSAVLTPTPYSSARMASSSCLQTPEYTMLLGSIFSFLHISSSPGLQTSSLYPHARAARVICGFAFIEKHISIVGPKMSRTARRRVENSHASSTYAGVEYL